MIDHLSLEQESGRVSAAQVAHLSLTAVGGAKLGGVETIVFVGWKDQVELLRVPFFSMKVCISQYHA